jgi:hypothetical protein
MKMKTMLYQILGIIAGMVLAFALVIAVEVFSSIVHPVPPGFTGTMDEMCEHVARYPHWVLGVAVIAWSATGFLGTWIATKIGGRGAGAVVSLLLLTALAFNIAKLPYTTWFKALMPVSLPAACYLALILGGHAKSRKPFDIAE